jgi:fatty acid desaturase
MLGMVMGNLGIGLSFGWWVAKHDRHHANPNTEGADPDIMLRALAMTVGQAGSSRGVSRIVSRCQAFLFFPICWARRSACMSPASRPCRAEPGKHRPAETVLLAMHFAAYLTVVFLVLSPLRQSCSYLSSGGLFGL